jgi:hypothetical protein
MNKGDRPKMSDFTPEAAVLQLHNNTAQNNPQMLLWPSIKSVTR